MSPGVVVLLLAFAGPPPNLPPGAVLRLGDDRWRAGGAVLELAFSPDAKKLTSRQARWADANASTVWDVATGIRLRDTLLGSTDAAGLKSASVRFPDGTATLSGGDGGAVVSDAATGKPRGRLGGHAGRVTAVAVSADGVKLATGDEDGLIRIWDAASLRPLSEPAGHRARVRSADLSADGRRLVTWGDDETARVWDLSTGRELRAFGGVGARARGSASPAVVTFSPDGNAVFLPAREGYVLRDILTGLEVPYSDPPPVGIPFLGQSGRMAALCAPPWEREIRIFEAATDQLRRALPAPRPSRVLGFAPDGAKLFTAGSDHTVVVWDVRPQAMPLTPEVRRETDAGRLWAAMCAGKSETSYLAMARLAAEPAAAVATARKRMRPAVAPTLAAVDDLLHALGDRDAAVRDAAERELDSYGEPAAELVQGRVGTLRSAEARRRAEAFVTRWTGPAAAATRLADSRAIELLESLGTPEAKAFLKELAGGEPLAWRTGEANRGRR